VEVSGVLGCGWLAERACGFVSARYCASLTAYWPLIRRCWRYEGPQLGEYLHPPCRGVETEALHLTSLSVATIVSLIGVSR
jgi:hypothetical protein